MAHLGRLANALDIVSLGELSHSPSRSGPQGLRGSTWQRRYRTSLAEGVSWYSGRILGRGGPGQVPKGWKRIWIDQREGGDCSR